MARDIGNGLHNHATWGPTLRAEIAPHDALHRHPILAYRSAPRFTSWAHNTPNHSHRLPDGAWTRPRTDLRPYLEADARPNEDTRHRRRRA